MKTLGTFCLFAALAVLALTAYPPSPAQALIAAHLDYNGCDTCHDLHGGPALFGGLLDDVTREATCLGCHGPLGIATEAAVHNPNRRDPDRFDYITCMECHNPHDNQPNVLLGTNIRLIGIEFDYNASPPEPQTLATIREENGGLGPIRNVVFEVRSGAVTDFHRADRQGICAICHASTNENEHGLTFLQGATCTNGLGCHPHSFQFLPPGRR